MFEGLIRRCGTDSQFREKKEMPSAPERSPPPRGRHPCVVRPVSVSCLAALSGERVENSAFLQTDAVRSRSASRLFRGACPSSLLFLKRENGRSLVSRAGAFTLMQRRGEAAIGAGLKPCVPGWTEARSFPAAKRPPEKKILPPTLSKEPE